MAMVVLPSPGGPERSTWSGVTLRFFAPVRTRLSWSRTLGWPMNSARLRGRRVVSMSVSVLRAWGLMVPLRAVAGSVGGVPPVGPEGPARLNSVFSTFAMGVLRCGLGVDRYCLPRRFRLARRAAGVVRVGSAARTVVRTGSAVFSANPRLARASSTCS